MNKIKNIAVFIALFLAITVFLINVVFIANVYNGWEEKVTISYFGILNLLISFVASIAIIILTNFVDKKIKQGNIVISKNKKLIILFIIFIIYAIIQMIWVYIRHSAPIADSMSVYEAAKQLSKGEDIFNPYYFEFNPQNLTLAYMFSIIFKLLHSSNLIILKYLNIIANCFIMIGLILIAKELKKDYKINMPLFIILAFTYIPIILLVNFVYGDLIGFAFTIFSIYFIIRYSRKRKIKYLFISSLLMALAIILRMNYMIFAIAIIIYLMLNLLEAKRKNIKVISLQLILILAFIIISLFPANILKHIVGSQYNVDTSKEFPTTRYIAMGMQEGPRANGWYNSTGDMGFEEIVPSSTYEKMIKERLVEFTKDIPYTIKFYIKKIASMWAEPLQESIWQNLSFNFGLYKGETEKDVAQVEEWKKVDEGLLKIEGYVKIYQKVLLFIIFGGIVCFILKNRKNISNEALLLLICFVGGFMFHIMWEGKSRYIIPYIIILIPLSCISLDILDNIKKIKEKIVKNVIKTKTRLKGEDYG